MALPLDQGSGSLDAAAIERLRVLAWCRSAAAQELLHAAFAVEQDGWSALWSAAWRLGGIALVGMILAAEVEGDLKAADQLARAARDRNRGWAA
jgi:hypothetical protein